jgi:NADH:ubiquinone reductase (H+-translocating)
MTRIKRSAAGPLRANDQIFMKKKRVLILGGGFGGLYAALEFEKRRDSDFEVTLISQDNFFLFTPMLHEVAASDLDLTHIVNPIRKMLRHVHFFEGEVRSVDIANRQVVVAHGFDQHTHSLEYDHIVFGLGCVTNFYGIPNLAETAVTMKSLGDAIGLRNRLIEHLEEADTECAANDREPLLTFVVAGGGFAGVETIGSINDFLKEALPYYSNLGPEMIRVVLVHPGEFVLPELGQELGRYASRKLAERGVEIRPKTKIKAITADGVELTDGSHISTRTLVWTAGTSPHPLLEKLPLPKERQRLKVNAAMGVEGYPGVWALGDCAMIPDEHGGYQPPTAQHAPPAKAKCWRTISSPKVWAKIWLRSGSTRLVYLPRSAGVPVLRAFSGLTSPGSLPGGSGARSTCLSSRA